MKKSLYLRLVIHCTALFGCLNSTAWAVDSIEGSDSKQDLTNLFLCAPFINYVEKQTPKTLEQYESQYRTITTLRNVCKETYKDFEKVQHHSTHACIRNLSRAEKQTLLRKAAIKGNLDFIKVFVQADCECDFICQEKDMKSPLHLAIEHGHVKIVHYLLEQRRDQTTALNKLLILHAVTAGHINMVRFLISQGADVHCILYQQGETLLHIAAKQGYLDIVKLLSQENNADINAETTSGMTPLNIAVSKGHLNLVKYLIEELKVDYEEDEILKYAISSGQLNIVKYLIEHRKIDINTLIYHENEHGYTALHLASFRKKLDLIEYLITQGAHLNVCTTSGKSPLYTCIDNRGSLEDFKYLITQGADINICDSSEQTLLDKALKMHRPDIAICLIQQGIKSKINPLDWAVKNLNLKLIKFMVEKQGADINTPLASGETPLHLILKTPNYKKDVAIESFLIQNGANLHTQNKQGETPLMLIKEYGLLKDLREVIE